MRRGDARGIPHIRWLVIVAATAVFAPPLIRIALGHQMTVPWNATLWLFDYEHGFIRRGLVGQIFLMLGIPSTYGVIHGASVWTAACAGAGFLAYVIWALRAHLDEPAVAALAAWAITSSGTIQQWFFDLGRFDAIEAILLVAAVVIVTATSSEWRGLTGIALVSGTGILIHEASFFWIPPLALSFWLLKFPCFKNVVRGAMMAMVLVALTDATAHATTAGELPLDGFHRYLSAKADFAVETDALALQYTNSLDETISQDFGDRSSLPALWRIAVALGLMGPVLLIGFGGIARERLHGAQDWHLRALCVGAALTPLTLFAIAVDYPRWLGMMATGLSISVVTLFRSRAADSLVAEARRYRVLLAAGTILNVLAGPYGVTSLFIRF